MTNKSKISRNKKKYWPNKKISRQKMNSTLKLDLRINNQTIYFLNIDIDYTAKDKKNKNP